MSTDKKIHALTGEFFLLLAKYGKDTFISMSEKLEYEDIDSAIKSISDKLKKTQEKKTTKTQVHDIKSLKNPEGNYFLPQENAIELRMISNILSSNTFKTKKELEFFIQEQKFVGVGLINFKTKQSIIDSFINAITQLSHEKLIEINHELTLNEKYKINNDDDRSLENWSRIILSSKDKKPAD